MSFARIFSEDMSSESISSSGSDDDDEEDNKKDGEKNENGDRE
jgi:hypothetical protein